MLAARQGSALLFFEEHDMSRFNTGNPVGASGSNDPRDFNDNLEALDQQINSDSLTFVDRLGRVRPSLNAAIDPTGLAQQAATDAQRAENAADNAFVNADIYESVSAGRAAVADGEQFAVLVGDEIVRYRRDSASTQTELAKFISSLYVKSKLRKVSSQSGYSWGIVDKNNKIALGLDLNGDLLIKGTRLVDLFPDNNQSIIETINDIKKQLYPSQTDIVCWGDSLTQGGGAGVGNYSTRLADMSGRSVLRRGMGGQISTQIAARQGGLGVTLSVDNNTIPSSGSVSANTLSINFLNNAGGSANTNGTLCGIYGNLSWTSAGGYVFTRASSGDSKQCLPNSIFIPDVGETPYHLSVFWYGRNQFNFSQTEQQLEIQSDIIKRSIKASIDNLKTHKKHFVVLGITSGAGSFEFAGSLNAIYRKALNAYLAETYPDNFIDIDTILLYSGSMTGQDLTDFNNGVIPSSLRTDSQHLNGDGYQIVAEAINSHINEKGW
jgi:lysophospholipase L1-like esterase